MTSYLLYIALHLLVCALIFVCVQRPAFFYLTKVVSDKPVGLRDLIQSARVGFRTDMGGAAYLTALPLLVLWVCAYVRPASVALPLMIAEGFVSIVLSLIVIGDIVLYPYWRFRIDVSVLAYLKSIKSALASVTAAYAAGAICCVLLVAAAVFGAFYGIGKLCGVYHAEVIHNTMWSVMGKTGAFILAGGVVFACIRGLRHRPNSPYHLYYSTNMYLNHAAVNPVFNMAYSASVKKKEGDSFHIFDTEECNREVKAVLPTEGKTQTYLLNNKRPNILVIVWESLSAHFIGKLGGNGVTENFDRLCDEGILFTAVDASSWRTDPAMVCILSGYPGQPTTSIMRDTHKLPGLPALPRTLQQAGYTTSVVHGGPLNYMHMVDYFLVTGHDRLIGIHDIDAEAPRCAWGVHDGYMFDWLYVDIMKRNVDEKPWYTTFLTLSSHQPFIVPFKKYPDEIDNAYAYTDDAFGRFIEKLKASPVWDDTLIVVMGDHGINVSFLPMARNLQPHIPILLLGGAIKESRQIDTLMAQTDFAATLLGQLDLPHQDFIFSRDVLADTYKYPFSINIYNNGFLYRDATGYTEFDNVAKRAVDGADDERERRGRMFMQYMMDDLSKR